MVAVRFPRHVGEAGMSKRGGHGNSSAGGLRALSTVAPKASREQQEA